MTDASTDQFAVPDSFLGQPYQIWYALYLLLRAGFDDPDAAVSVEDIDDIGVLDAGGLTKAVQTKRTTTDLTDSSVPLWKTLRIWAEHIAQGKIDLDHTELALVSTSNAPAGSAASMLRPADPKQPAARKESSALGLLEAVARESKNVTLAKAFKAFKALTADQQKALLRQIRVLDNSPDISGIKTEIAKQIRLNAPPGKEDAFADALGARWRSLVDHALEQHVPVTYVDVRHVIQDLQQQFQSANLPIEFREKLPGILPPVSADTRRFVQQLLLIEVGNERIDDARLDYFRASKQRGSWARKKLIGIDEIPRYERLVREEWRRRHRALRERLSSQCSVSDKVETGRQVYHWAELDAITMPSLMIRPNCNEPFVLRGTFHLLADLEDDGIGWHPEFEALLASKREGSPT